MTVKSSPTTWILLNIFSNLNQWDLLIPTPGTLPLANSQLFLTDHTLQCATSPHHPQCHTHNHTTQVHNNRHRSLRLQTTKTKTKTQNTVFGNKIWGFLNCFRETVFPKLKKKHFPKVQSYTIPSSSLHL